MLPRYASPFPNQHQNSTPSQGQAGMNMNMNFMNMPNPQMGFPQGMGFVPNGFPARGPPSFGPNQNQFYPNQFAHFNPMQMQMGGYQPPPNPGFMPGPQFGNFPFHRPMNQNRPIGVPVPTMNSPQGNPVRPEEASKNFGGRNWENNSNHRRGRPQNSRFNNHTTGRNNFRSPNSQNGRGKNNDNTGNFGFDNSRSQGRDQTQKRSLALTYSEQEIKQWREERKRNFPSKENIEKKQNKKMLDQEGLQKEAQLRQERLKEILTKQAELGVEVAEIPGCYISDPKKQGRNKFEKRNDKRGRNENKTERRFNKKQRHEGSSSSTETPKKKPPTLLQKLLSSDVKRDKSQLIQAFRFMVMNSFFGDSDSPLKFPRVVVEENGVSEITDKKDDECNSEIN